MKKIVVFALMCIICISCETESHIIKNEPQDNILNNPALKSKLLRVSQYKTAVDNVIDGTSCFAVNLPVTVVVNDQPVIIDDAADYQQVRDILEASADDTDSVLIQFPITVTYADYTEQPIANQPEFNNAVAGCQSSMELSCMQLLYPLEIKAYDFDNQFAEVFTIGNKRALFRFLNQQSNYGAVSFAYPLTLNNPDGTGISIADNTLLESTIDSYTQECLDMLIPGPVELEFEEVIVQGSWHVSYFFRDTDQTSDYAAYDFTFNPDGTVAVSGVTPNTGTWESYTDSGELKAEYTFSSTSLEELEEDWTVTEFTATLIKMEHESGGGSEIRYFYLQKN
jgi:hypothetical protein